MSFEFTKRIHPKVHPIDILHFLHLTRNEENVSSTNSKSYLKLRLVRNARKISSLAKITCYNRFFQHPKMAQMSSLICNKCFAPIYRGKRPYHITQCGHISCQNCLQQGEKEFCITIYFPRFQPLFIVAIYSREAMSAMSACRYYIVNTGGSVDPEADAVLPAVGRDSGNAVESGHVL